MKIKNLIIHIVMIVTVIVGSINLGFAQDSSQVSSIVNLDLGADIVSRYVWRGTQLGGASPNIQPYIEMGIGNFVIGIWGAYSLGGDNPFQEFDLYATYNLFDDKVSITLTDYFFPDESSDYKYFDYADTTTGHIFEGKISFNGTDKIPFSVFIAVNLYGADASRISDNPASLNSLDGIQNSTYLELGYETTLNSGVKFEAFVGFNLTDPRSADLSGSGYVGETGFYGNDIGVVNLGITVSKDIKISEDFSLPMMTSVITNPQAQKVYLVFGFSL
ncbi:MAG: hypothetical protein IH852_09885 [Bacteroidetes bacterium]|nr:hypothetical protein [Bacteroidota bacterium]